jgi:hypothetical protein
MDGHCIWSLAQAPDDADRILAGTHPAGLFRSIDGGETWIRLEREFGEVRSLLWQPG